MKNDNAALPLSKGSSVVLFGLAAYAPYPYSSGDLKGGNEDAVDLVQALEAEGLTVNAAVRDFYTAIILNKHEEMVPNRWTGEPRTSSRPRAFPLTGAALSTRTATPPSWSSPVAPARATPTRPAPR